MLSEDTSTGSELSDFNISFNFKWDISNIRTYNSLLIQTIFDDISHGQLVVVKKINVLLKVGLEAQCVGLSWTGQS